ncbi:hypothetical protein CAC42_5601 [Sphaceloma murrayae]|uniref:2'-phosphotransferase n=1 Tax=Sphaceloma murrayae TaxID=2082308 RepID=A0A2K1QYM5_9PEZI|nr:hypothetical protein CAC42_5601 [Sphaceloma murrayae]
MPRPPMTRDVQVSKKLSWLLRHGIGQEKLQMDAAGYVNVADVLSNRNIRSLKVTLDELKELVATNNKQRFSLISCHVQHTTGAVLADASCTAAELDAPVQPPGSASDNPSDYLIRANQGHSVAIDSDSLLTKIDGTNIPDVCVHGTTKHAWTLIASSGGLRRMTRQHVHFAAGLPAGFKSIAKTENTAAEDGTGPTVPAPVISGMRNSSTILIYLDFAKAIDGGLKFWKSANDVILTDGNEEGLVPLTFFKRVEDRTGGQGILVQDGQILKQPPAEWAHKGPNQRNGRAGAKKPQLKGEDPGMP